MEDEKKIKNSPDYISISGTQTILNQMRNSICKIKINQINGTGFFCKIPYENNTMNVLMTNYHILDKEYYNKNDALNLFINDEKDVKIINLKINRTTYFSEIYDLALIELKESDGIPINIYLDLDDNLFKKEINAFYDKKSIYVLQYPLGNDAAVSYGLSKEINNYEIKHTCSTEHGSSGSPILNLSNNKVIGIHKQGAKNFKCNINYNIGTCLQFPLNDFFEKNKKENDPNKIFDDVLNKYLQKSEEFYERSKNYMNDMIYHIEHGQVMNITFNVFVPNSYGNRYKLHLDFSSNLVLKFGTTIDDMLKIYFKLKGRGDLINYNGNEIYFLWNMFKLGFGDQTPIEIFFINTLNPSVNVYLNDHYFFENNYNNHNKLNIKELDDALLIIYFKQIFDEKKMGIGMNNENNIAFKIDNDILNKGSKKREAFYEYLNNRIKDMKYEIGPGPKMNIIFKTTQGCINTLILNHGTTIDQMLRIYCRRFFRENIRNIIEKELCFLFHANRIKLGDKTPVEHYFRNEVNPILNVNSIVSDSDSNIYKFSKEEINLIDLCSKRVSEEIYGPNPKPKPNPKPEPIQSPSGEINVKFNKDGNIVIIKMDDSCLVFELIYEYYEKTKEKNRKFIFNNKELFELDSRSLKEVGLKKNSEIFVK